MKKLFLASYASNVVDRVLEILPKKPNYLTLAFVPTARDPYKITATVDPEKEKLKAMGFSIKVVDLKNKTKEELRKDFKNIDVIFIAGGNIFYLLEKTLESGFFELVKELVEKGVVYIGSSAGAVLAGPDIDIIRGLDDPNEAPNLKNTTGLKLVDFIILPHYGEGIFKVKTIEIYKQWKNSNYKIIPLTNRQAVIVEENKYRIIES
jgi:dipeptidase E